MMAALDATAAAPATAGSPLGLRQKMAYGAGDLASNLVWGLSLSFIMYYYTDIYAIPAATAAWLLLVPRAIDAFCDPLVGYAVDRSGGRIVRPLIRTLALPFGILTFLCFVPWPLPPAQKILWAGGTYLLLGMVYSAVNTPYGVLGAMMAITRQERIDLNSFRIGACQLGQFLVGATVLPLIAWFALGAGKAGQERGLLVIAASIGTLSTLLWLATARLCTVRRWLPVERGDPRRLIRALVRNRLWHVSSALTFCNFMVFCTQNALAVHVSRLWLHRPAADAALLLSCQTIASLAGISLLTPLLTRRWGMRRTYLVLLAGQAVCLIGLAGCAGRIELFLPLLAAQYFCMGPLSPLCLSVVSQAVEEGRARTGIAAAGMAFACNTLVGKLAVAVAGFGAAGVLSLGHYNPDVVQGDAALLRWLMTGYLGIPLLSAALAALVLLFCRPDEPASPEEHA